ncbi:unnamed protein product [Calypogeia fissa]
MDEKSGFKITRTMVKRPALGSDFEYKNSEFSSLAIANRRFRRRRITPLMRWQFAQELLRMMGNIRNMRPSIDNRPPETPSIAVMHRNRQQIEESRLRVIEIENHEMLERLRNIHNRPKSYFCHLKKRGVPLVKGDAYRLRPPTGRGLYLIQMYKKLKLANPVSARKSIRVQQEMLESAIELVQKSENKPSEELIDSVVQMKLATVDELPSPDSPDSQERPQTPLELVQIANPIPGSQVVFGDLDELLGIETPPESPSEARSDSSGAKPKK